MTHRPWSELTKHWSPERRAENERAKVKIRAHIRSLQTGGPTDDAAGDTPPAQRTTAPAPSPSSSGLDPIRG